MSDNPSTNALGARGIDVTRDGRLVRVYRLNAGSGAQKYHDCANVDISPAFEPDFCANLDGEHEWPFGENTFDSAYVSHFLEHLKNPLGFMKGLHKACVHDAIAIFRVPYGSSDNAWEDPTHVRPYFLDSFGYFSQAAYGGADYGYRGDWTIIDRELTIRDGLGMEQYKDDLQTLLGFVMSHRNIVEEMKVVLKCVKPLRTPGTFQEGSPVSFVFKGKGPSAKIAH